MDGSIFMKEAQDFFNQFEVQDAQEESKQVTKKASRKGKAAKKAQEKDRQLAYVERKAEQARKVDQAKQTDSEKFVKVSHAQTVQK